MLSVLIVSGFGCNRQDNAKNGSAEIDREQILSDAKKSGLIMNETEISAMADPARLQTVSGSNPKDISGYVIAQTEGWKSAALADVTGGGSFGLAFTNVENGSFTLIAKMGNLPAAQEGFHYEGWLVRRGEDMRVVSVGEPQPKGEQYANVFLSKTDLSDYDFYVLTLEPNDQNPAPAQHLLEGALK